MKIRIFVQTYTAASKQRNAELQECLAANMALDGVQVFPIERPDRIHFSEWFKIINEVAGKDDISILCNSDIKFDASLMLACDMAHDECFALTRWEGNRLHDVGTDAWIFKGPIRKVEDCDFGLGIADCDFAINERLHRAGYRLANPSADIKATHVHASNYRTYYQMKKIGPPHLTHIPQLSLARRHEKAQVFTCYSPSHSNYFEKYFKPSLPDNVQLHVIQMPQLCVSGVYHTQGWREQMCEKLRVMIHAAETCDTFIFLDVDIKVRSPFFAQTMIEELGIDDIAFQKDANTACTGCFIARGNERTVKLFKDALAIMDAEGCDQKAINVILKRMGNIRWKFLSSKFWNYSFFFPGEYDGRLKFVIPQYAILVHANWCKGEILKTKILDMA